MAVLHRFYCYCHCGICRKVGLDDEGPYTCRAANEGGFKEEKAYVRVQGQYSKTFVKQPLSKNPQIGFQDQLSLDA